MIHNCLLNFIFLPMQEGQYTQLIWYICDLEESELHKSEKSGRHIVGTTTSLFPNSLAVRNLLILESFSKLGTTAILFHWGILRIATKI